MSRLTKKRPETEIPTSSFSDIAFLLIIYFMVATSLIKVKSIAADLPAGEKTAQAKSDKTPIVNLRGKEVFYNDKAINMTELQVKLSDLDLKAQESAKRVIMLESTRDTPYEDYFKVLAAISANGGVVALVEEGKK